MIKEVKKWYLSNAWIVNNLNEVDVSNVRISSVIEGGTPF